MNSVCDVHILKHASRNFYLRKWRKIVILI